MLFQDRRDAGRKLAAALEAYKGAETIVLAIPRGGVVVGFEVAQALEAPLDIIIPRKIGAPQDPELAVGAVTPDGSVFYSFDSLRKLGLTPDDLASIVATERAEIRRRMRAFRGEQPFPSLQGKTVILVDDGIATGFTVRAALASIKQQNPSRVVLAVPVAPAEVEDAFVSEADAFVCLAHPEPFFAVGQFYRDFTQTSDAEVIFLLQAARRAS